VKRFFREKVPDAPSEFFEVLDGQQERLVKAQEKFGSYVPPEKFPIVE
jgi:hypothetical protein